MYVIILRTLSMLMIFISIIIYGMKNHTIILILIDEVAYKTLFVAKPLRIIFDKVDGYIRKYDKSKTLRRKIKYA